MCTHYPLCAGLLSLFLIEASGIPMMLTGFVWPASEFQYSALTVCTSLLIESTALINGAVAAGAALHHLYVRLNCVRYCIQCRCPRARGYSVCSFGDHATASRLLFFKFNFTSFFDNAILANNQYVSLYVLSLSTEHSLSIHCGIRCDFPFGLLSSNECWARLFQELVSHQHAASSCRSPCCCARCFLLLGLMASPCCVQPGSQCAMFLGVFACALSRSIEPVRCAPP